MQGKIFILIIIFFLVGNIAFSAGIKAKTENNSAPLSLPENILKQNLGELYAPNMKPDVDLGTTVPYKKPISQEEIKKQATTLPPQSLEPKLKTGTYAQVRVYNKISLPEAIEYALSHNLEIIESRKNIDIARNDMKTANRLKNPYIPFFLNDGQASKDNPDMVAIVLPIEIAKRGPRKNLAKSNYHLAVGNVLLQELYLRLDVRRAYLNLVAAKSNLKILDDQRKLLQDLVIITQKKYKAGASPAMDIIHAKMTLNQLLVQVNSARTEVEIERYRFNLILESNDFDSKEDYLPEQKEFVSMLTPNPSGIMPDFETVFNIAMENRLDIKNARQEIDVANKKLTTVIRQRVPDIEIGAGFMYVPKQYSTTKQDANGFYAVGEINNIPLLYLHNPEIKNAKIEVEQKELAYNNVRHHALVNLRSAYANFVTAQTNLNYYNDILLTESNQFLLLARRSYEIGKTSITDYIFIEQSYKNIMLGYVAALANYYNAWVGVLREVNDEEFKLDD